MEKTIEVGAGESAALASLVAGIKANLKCSDGICECGLIEGDFEHRDLELSAAQRRTEIVTCQSRAQEKNGVITLDV